MRFQQTLQELRNHLKNGRRNQRPMARKQRRLWLERLEDRTLLSVTFNAGPYVSPFIGAELDQGNHGWFPVEPYISINPTNPANVVLTDQGVLKVSTDGGLTYGSTVNFPNGANGDTYTVFDSQGRLFWSNLGKNATDPFSTPYVVQVNPNSGAIIGSPVAVSAPTGTGAIGDDKDVIGSDGTNLYETWIRYFSGGTKVELSRSTDHGATWSSPTVVSASDFSEGFVWGSTVSVLSDGSISVAYHASANNGEVLVANYTNDLSSLFFKTTVMTNVNAPGSFPKEPWQNNIGQQIAWVVGDRTRSGTVYVVFLNYPNVVFAKSTNFGSTWTTTNIVSGSDPGNFEAYPTAAIDQFGNLAVAWYTNGRDLFDSSGFYLLDLRAMYSTDGGSTWSSSFQVNQNHHFDPNSSRIDDYFGINLFAGTVYIAWEGNTFDNSGNVTGEQVETSTFGLNGSLRINDDSPGSNVITIDTFPALSTNFEVVVNGVREFAGPYFNLTGISVNESNATDTVNIENTFFGLPVTVNEGSGNDIVNISPVAELLDHIQGDVFVNGGFGTDTLNVADQHDGFNATWTLTSLSVTYSFSAVIHYNLQNKVNITGGNGTLTYNILDTEPGSFATTSLDTGPGSDTINVQATGSAGTLNINNDFKTSNQDTVTIGSTAPTLGGTLANIAGPVNVSNASGHTTLNVDDSGDATGRTVTVTNGSITGNWSPAAINYTGGQVSALNLLGGHGGNTFNVRSTAANTTTLMNVNDTNTLNNNNTVTIGSLAPSLGGTLANIAGPVNISSSSKTTLVLDDSGDTTARAVTITNNSVTGPWSPGAINYLANAVSSLILHSGNAANTFNVQSTGPTTNLVLAGHTAVNVGNAGSVQTISGTLNIENPTSFNTIVVDDSTDTTARTATLSTLGLNPADSQANTDPWGQIIGLAPAHINYEYADTPSLTIKGGGGSGTHTYNILATGSGVATTIVGGTGTNSFDVGSNGTFAGIVKNITSHLTLNGGTGSNSLTLDDSGNTTTTDTVSLTPTSAGGSAFFGAGGSLTHSAFQSVTLNSSNASLVSVGHVFGDNITVTPQSGILFTINGGNPPAGSHPGDRLTVTPVIGTVTIHPGTPAGTGFFTFTGSSTHIVDYTGIETPSPAGWLVTAPDAGHSPEIKVFNAQSGELKFDFLAFDPSFRGGVRVAVGDVNGDGIPDIIAAQGPSDGSSGDSLVHVYDGITGQPLAGPLGSFDPFPGFHGGLYVASADLNGDGYADVVVAEDAGGQPRIRVFSGKDGNLLDDFLAFDSSFSGGVRVAAADVNHDGTADIVAAAGPGSTPLVEVFEGTDLAQGVTTPRLSFDAYAPSFTGGVYVATGDVHGDGIPKILTGAGAGDEPRVNVFDGITGDELQSFLAFDPSFRGGVRVAAADVNGDGRSDIVAAQGPGGVPRVRGFDGLSLQQIDEFFAFHPNFRDGVFVAGGGRWGLFHSLDGHAESGDALPRIVVGQGAGSRSVLSVFDGSTKDQPQNLEGFQPGHGEGHVAAPDVNGDGRSDLITTEGAGRLPRVRGWDGFSLEQIDQLFAFDPNFRDGVFVAGGGRWR